MITINRTDDLIVGSINGNPFSVTFDETKYSLMKDLEQQSHKVETVDELKSIVDEILPLTKESYKQIVETICPYLFVNKHTNKFYLQYYGVLSSKALPQVLVDKILTCVEKKIDIVPLIKCWVRFLRNEKYTDSKAVQFAKYINASYTDHARVAELMETEGLSEDAATKLATTPQVAITLEGLLVGYKVSEEVTTKFALDEDEETVITKSRYKKSVDPDTGLVTYDKPVYAEELLFRPAIMKNKGNPFWCVGANTPAQKGHLIRVGAVHYLDSWDEVNCDDNSSCVAGLHVGGLSYIKGYQTDGTATHNVLIDPMDIGAICDINYGDGALRVRRYFVHSSFAGVNKNIYHSSKYAEMNDEEYKARIEEVVKATQMSKDQMYQQLNELQVLTYS